MTVFGTLKTPATLIVGLGTSGLSMARWCARQGCRLRIADTRATPPNAPQLNAEGLDAELITGALTADLLDGGIELVAISPGLSLRAAALTPLLNAACARDIPVWGELEFFAQALRSAEISGGRTYKVLAVTGTNGKTTTAALVGRLCERAGYRTGVAGNIGMALLDALGAAIDGHNMPDIWVLELSSFQLVSHQTFSPDAATVLNITPDHLDWHGDFNAYAAAKSRIFGGSTLRILNRDDAQSMACARDGGGSAGELKNRRNGEAVPGKPLKIALEQLTFGLNEPQHAGEYGLTRTDDGTAWLAVAEPCTDSPAVTGRARRHVATDAPLEHFSVRLPKERARRQYEQYGEREATPGKPLKNALDTVVKRLMPASALAIRGAHNVSNALAALALCRAIGLPLAPLLHGLRDYRGEPHRFQRIACIDGIDFIDDSKGTNVNATLAALTGTDTTRIVLIAGGDGKGQDFGPLAAAVTRVCRAVVLIGRDAPLLRAVLAPTGVPLAEYPTLEAATRAAADIAQSGDTVLLSPACASFDMFRDYRHRAEVFRTAVEALLELAHFSARLHKERARRQYGDRCGRSRPPSLCDDGGDPAASPNTRSDEATPGKPLKNALSARGVRS